MKWMIMVVAGLLMAAPTWSQSKTKKKISKIGDKVNKFFQNVKDEVTYTADGLFSGNNSDLIPVDGTYYMPIYKTNLYNGSGAKSLTALCRSAFLAKYPNASIVSCVLPQKEWNSTPVKNGDDVTGYIQTMYCFVLARDGEDGYINAKYEFVRSRKVGQSYVKDSARWPQMIRTDILTNEVYKKLLDR